MSELLKVILPANLHDEELEPVTSAREALKSFLKKGKALLPLTVYSLKS